MNKENEVNEKETEINVVDKVYDSMNSSTSNSKMLHIANVDDKIFKKFRTLKYYYKLNSNELFSKIIESEFEKIKNKKISDLKIDERI